MIYWAPFLHFYQPPTQFHAILKKIANESYRPLLKMLLTHPTSRLTANICGVLTEMLNDHGYTDIIDSICELGQKGQIEFVDSAKYHAILPLIPEEETKRQIEQNRQTNSYFFKDSYKPTGFFPPEMCYSDDVAVLLHKMGYKWILISGIACSENWPLDVIHKTRSGINVFYRDDIISNKISFHNINSTTFIIELLDLNKSRAKNDTYVITAMDAETFGHHIQNWEKLFLAEAYEIIEGITNHKDLKQRTDLADMYKKIQEGIKEEQIEVVTISELLQKFPTRDAKAPFPSSWSSTGADLQNNNFYPLWQDPSNVVHSLQWEHVNICFELIEKANQLKSNQESKRFYEIARLLLDRAIHSCQFWWANKKYGLWDMNLINKGLMMQEEVIVNAFRSIKSSDGPTDIKTQFYYKWVASRSIASKIRDQLFL